MSLVTPRKGYKSVPWLFGKEIEIPEGWEKTTVGKHTFILIGNAFPSKEYSKNPKDMRLLRGDNITEGTARWKEKTRYWSNYSEFKKYQLFENDFVISMDGSKVGKNYTYIKKLDLPCLLVQRVACLRSKSTLIQKYFGYIFGDKNFINYVNSVRTNSGIPHISTKDIQKFSLLLPPLPEQKQIATILSNVDNLIESTVQVITHSKKVKKGLMQKLLTRGIGHTKFKKVPWLFGKEIEIPQEWENVNVEYVADKLLSGGTPSTTIVEYWEGNIPWTKGAILTTNNTTKGEKFISELGLKNSSTSIISKDNLLVVSRVSIGNISINKIDIAINQDITAVILNKTICLTDFLYWNLLQTVSILVSFSQGTTIQGFTRKDLSSHKVLLPPLPEQQKIASILSNIDSKITSQEQYKEKLQKLKKSLMQKLLTGEVRVIA